MVSLQYWNRAAIIKLLWALSKKEDKLWVRWIHIYYVKNKNVWLMDRLTQAAWIIQKNFAIRKHQQVVQDWISVMYNGMFSIKKAYLLLRGDHEKMPWKSITCDNIAPPRAIFICWVALSVGLRGFLLMKPAHYAQIRRKI